MQRPMPTRFAVTALVLAAAALTAAGPASAGAINESMRAVTEAGHPHPAARPAPAPAPAAQPAHEMHRQAPAPTVAPVREVRRVAAPAMVPPHEFHHERDGGRGYGRDHDRDDGRGYGRDHERGYGRGYGAPRVVVTQVPVYVQAPPQPQYVQAGWNTCGAPQWDPNVRYMPGQVVVRQGNLYIATDESAAVWNVNSPPEWTPNYWVQAVCSQ
ncbi:hypothetical protein ACPWT1_21485 [Ramlibacter sp. MMS24-I3-19]|uniref:hypothetical protein n=1 Tax=Ramlibacter sp. MMS24-I3-19 TaxID=3416606 RepID=UPI003D01CD70